MDEHIWYLAWNIKTKKFQETKKIHNTKEIQFRNSTRTSRISPIIMVIFVIAYFVRITIKTYIVIFSKFYPLYFKRDKNTWFFLYNKAHLSKTPIIIFNFNDNCSVGIFRLYSRSLILEKRWIISVIRWAVTQHEDVVTDAFALEMHSECLPINVEINQILLHAI